MEAEMNGEDFFEKILEDKRIFWEETYKTLSLEERRKVWCKDVSFGMRRQPEETQDEYDSFSKSWYEFATSVEPNFDEIFEYVIKNMSIYKNSFNWEEYSLRITK